MQTTINWGSVIVVVMMVMMMIAVCGAEPHTNSRMMMMVMVVMMTHLHRDLRQFCILILYIGKSGVVVRLQLGKGIRNGVEKFPVI
jgi:hypothetical protein